MISGCSIVLTRLEALGVLFCACVCVTVFLHSFFFLLSLSLYLSLSLSLIGQVLLGAGAGLDLGATSYLQNGLNLGAGSALNYVAGTGHTLAGLCGLVAYCLCSG